MTLASHAGTLRAEALFVLLGQTIWQDIESALGTVWNGIESFFAGIFGSIAAAIETVFGSLVAPINASWQDFQAAVAPYGLLAPIITALVIAAFVMIGVFVIWLLIKFSVSQTEQVGEEAEEGV
jgi:hypothetical protein